MVGELWDQSLDLTEINDGLIGGRRKLISLTVKRRL